MQLGLNSLVAPGAFRMALAGAVFLHHTTFFNVGMSSVLVFFVLSGYWVARMWTHDYVNTISPYYTYLISRIWRIIPVFALASIISWGLLLWREGRPNSIGSLTHQIFSNILIIGYNSLPFQANVPGWSLDIEIQFYVIAPLIIFLISRSIYALFLFVLISLFSKSFGGAASLAPFLYFFGIGISSALLEIAPTRQQAYVTLVVAAMMMFACLIIAIYNNMLVQHSSLQLVFSHRENLLLAVIMTPWALYTVRQPSSIFDRMLGDLSYIFYLLHWSILGVLKTGEGSFLFRLVNCSFALILITFLSYLIWRFYDHPINKLRGQWVKNRAKTNLL